MAVPVLSYNTSQHSARSTGDPDGLNQWRMQLRANPKTVSDPACNLVVTMQYEG
jgi:hypothetical protein